MKPDKITNPDGTSVNPMDSCNYNYRYSYDFGAGLKGSLPSCIRAITVDPGFSGGIGSLLLTDPGIVAARTTYKFIFNDGSEEGPFRADKIPDWIRDMFVEDQNAEFEIIEPKLLTYEKETSKGDNNKRPRRTKGGGKGKV